MDKRERPESPELRSLDDVRAAAHRGRGKGPVRNGWKRSPHIERWTEVGTTYFDSKGWTNQCQGITFDGAHFYVTSNGKHTRGVYKLGLDFAVVKSERLDVVHVGDLDYFEGRLWISVEQKNTGNFREPHVLVLDTDLKPVTMAPLRGADGDSAPPQGNMPWCAVDPLTGLLFSSGFDGVTEMHAYDLEKFSYRRSLELALDEPLNSVQGGAISQHGHLYLSSHKTLDIRAFSMQSGHCWGAKKFEIHPELPYFEEVEGLCIGPLGKDDHRPHVHLVLLDQDGLSDDVYLKHFRPPPEATL